MASVYYKIDVKLIFNQEKTDLTKCFSCKEKIYSDMHRLLLKVNDTIESTNYLFCESCKNVLND